MKSPAGIELTIAHHDNNPLPPGMIQYLWAELKARGLRTDWDTVGCSSEPRLFLLGKCDEHYGSTQLYARLVKGKWVFMTPTEADAVL